MFVIRPRKASHPSSESSSCERFMNTGKGIFHDPAQPMRENTGTSDASPLVEFGYRHGYAAPAAGVPEMQSPGHTTSSAPCGTFSSRSVALITMRTIAFLRRVRHHGSWAWAVGSGRQLAPPLPGRATSHWPPSYRSSVQDGSASNARWTSSWSTPRSTHGASTVRARISRRCPEVRGGLLLCSAIASASCGAEASEGSENTGSACSAAHPRRPRRGSRGEKAHGPEGAGLCVDADSCPSRGILPSHS
mmetsp:Transcript_7031/g.20321  ORF Transcript_7031/g.20321 Transcript_7031/m.20321 type:complete len:248 (+) Transcript_7031:702-1445(+)